MTGSRAAATVTSFLAILTGVILVILPWTPHWDQNYFLDAVPILKQLLLTNVVRAGVTGLGLIDLAIGIAEANRLDSPSEENSDSP